MDVTAIALAATAVLLGLSLVAAVVARKLAGRAVGRPVAAELASRALLAPLAFIAALVAVLVLGAEVAPLAVLVGALSVWFVAPRLGDRVLGRDGLRRGWLALRFEDVTEWRLTGEHLRVRLLGEWEAVPAPTADHAELRRVLEERAPGRETRFTS